ncbi:MAG: zinc-ribbon domain-containing protein [Clostridia bacterium]|nr:zinc-ribbon domain-containing protein [Clostridia bacterium]
MKSIKKGRAPSAMEGIGGVFAALFGIFWTVTALSIGAPPLFAAFGLIFVGLAVSGAIYNFRNATSKKRFSEYDIVETGEEDDPLNERFGEDAGPGEGEQTARVAGREAFSFCPYCGAELDRGDNFCGKCGKRMA